MKELKTAEEVLADKCHEVVQAFIDNPGLHVAVLEAMQAYAAQEKGAEYKKGWNDALDKLEEEATISPTYRTDIEGSYPDGGHVYFIDEVDFKKLRNHWQPLPPKP